MRREGEESQGKKEKRDGCRTVLEHPDVKKSETGNEGSKGKKRDEKCAQEKKMKSRRKDNVQGG